MTAMKQFTTSDGLRLAYDDRGSGLPLLCLAGLTRNMADFEPILAPLAGSCRLIRLDSRGRGLSDHDPDYMNYNVLREAHDVLELLDHLGIAKVAILGTSRGGLIAMALAAMHRERLLGVILNDVGPEVGTQGMTRIMEYVGIPPVEPTYEAVTDRLTRSFADEFPGVSRVQWRQAAERMWRETPEGLVLRYDPLLRRALIEQSAAGAAPDLWLFFDQLKGLPVTVLHGEHSDILSAATVEKMRARHPDLVAVTVRNRGHTPFLDEPECLAAIQAFVALLQPASTA